MSAKAYKVASEEAVVRFADPERQLAVGDEVELELEAEQELALLAAGWLEPAPKKGKEA